MELRDFLSRLRVKSGPNGKGEYMCCCPAHDDKSASLSVRDTEKGILIHCQTEKCSNDEIVKAMGLTMRDLFHDDGRADLVPGHTVRKAKPAAARPAKAPAKDKPEEDKPFPSYQAAYGYLGKFVCAYVYRDGSGKPLFEVARIDTSAKEGKRAKTFRQHRLVGQGWTFPLVKGVPDELKDTLYHLPEVLAAIKANKPVYVVEGEKDADTLAQLGRVATTQAMGAGKWREAHSAHMQGADAIILQDNDEPGKNHAEMVAAALVGKAKRVRVIDLTTLLHDLPEHGDISDVAAKLGGTEAMKALDKAVSAAKDVTANPMAERDAAAAYYGKVYGYCVDHGRICQATSDGPKPLANFVALPVSVNTRDDGVTVTKNMVFDGWTETGKPLPRVEVKASQFESMKWVTECWDFAASLMPGNNVAGKVVYAIKAVGNMTAKRITEYMHTGWRKIGGKWAYLYQGGAIGAEGVSVDLGNGLSMYRLDGNGLDDFDKISFQEGAIMSLAIKDCVAPHVAIPLLGTIFLAPLREFLAATGIAPAYALFLLGGTGTRKSTALALALSHFGNFTAKSLPASFNDTANFIRKKAFLLKDAPIVVDDYHPVTSLQERKKMEATAQSLARAFGDGAERGRMKSDLSLQESSPPRGVAIISGEDTPGVGESGMARFYVANVGREDVPATEMLTAMQESARQGCLQKSMRGYILWLLQQIDELPKQLHDDFIKARAMALKRTAGQHGRTAEAIAHMMLGYQSMLRYMRDVKAITTEQAVTLLEEAWNVATQNSQKQADDMREDRPSKIFLSTISELLISKSAGVRDMTAAVGTETPGPSTGRDMIGYMDNDFYYLMPNVAYRAVAKLCNDQGQAFPLTAKMLYKQMREDGILTPDTTTSTSATRPKWIDGKSQRLLWVPRVHIDGPKQQKAQEQMTMDGYTVVSEPDLPFE